MIEVVSTFQQRFNEALQIRDIKPVDIAKRTGISESTISQYRSGYAKPKQDKLAILSNALHVNPVWLMGLNVPMEAVETFATPDEFELAWHRRGGGRHPIELSDTEHEIILSYRVASDGIKDSINKLLDIKIAENKDMGKRLKAYKDGLTKKE